jgi:hypothetical protein
LPPTAAHAAAEEDAFAQLYQSTMEQRAFVERVFDHYDLSGDGVLSLAEFRPLARDVFGAASLPRSAMRAVRALCPHADWSQDGEEWAHFCVRHGGTDDTDDMYAKVRSVSAPAPESASSTAMQTQTPNKGNRAVGFRLDNFVHCPPCCSIFTPHLRVRSVVNHLPVEVMYECVAAAERPLPMKFWQSSGKRSRWVPRCQTSDFTPYICIHTACPHFNRFE